MESKERDIPEIKEPFCSGREAYRQLFDFSILMSCIRNSDNRRILDFAGGSGWVAEFLNRAGFDVTTFDIIEKSIALDEINELARKICLVRMYALCRFKM